MTHPALGGISVVGEFPEPGEQTRVLKRINNSGLKWESRVSFAAIVERVTEKQQTSTRPVGDLGTAQLVELAAVSVERLLPQLHRRERAEVERQLDTWHDWTDGNADASELGASADAMRHATDGVAQTSGDDENTLARACVRMAADAASAASELETARTPSLRHRLLWKARMAAERVRMAADLLCSSGHQLA